ncbi:MAG: hypothetical protein EWM72_00390 [Nitrospira sp.]|nr:MAG: hypothetical protein EWM72_00390 [Nitrospira sp.]
MGSGDCPCGVRCVKHIGLPGDETITERSVGRTARLCLWICTDLGSPVSVDYFDKAPFKFNGKIENVHVQHTK